MCRITLRIKVFYHYRRTSSNSQNAHDAELILIKEATILSGDEYAVASLFDHIA